MFRHPPSSLNSPLSSCVLSKVTLNARIIVYGNRLQPPALFTVFWPFLTIFLTTVRPQDTRPQAARTLQVHVFEWEPKNLRWTKLCSENLEQHRFLIILPSPYKVTKVARILSCTSFSFPQKTCISRPYCIYLSQNWGSHGHFEVLNGSVPQFIQ